MRQFYDERLRPSCFRNCVPPTRYAGCHDVCETYLAQREIWDKHKAEVNKENDFEKAYCEFKKERVEATKRAVSKVNKYRPKR